MLFLLGIRAIHPSPSMMPAAQANHSFESNIPYPFAALSPGQVIATTTTRPPSSRRAMASASGRAADAGTVNTKRASPSAVMVKQLPTGANAASKWIAFVSGGGPGGGAGRGGGGAGPSRLRAPLADAPPGQARLAVAPLAGRPHPRAAPQRALGPVDLLVERVAADAE